MALSGRDYAADARNAGLNVYWVAEGDREGDIRLYAVTPANPCCNCYTCRTFSRAYLRHLYVSKELLSFRLNSLHNLTYFLSLVRGARKAILEGTFADYKAHIESLYPEEVAMAQGTC